MKRNMILKLAASTMAISVTLTGCFGGGNSSVASVSSKAPSAKDGPKYAKKAEKALAKGQVDKAVVYAERSVAGVANDPDTRFLLGQAYMQAGRFASAERSFHDVMELGRSDARTVLSLALAQLAQGKANKAVQLVRDNRNSIPASDYGLALALGGEAKEGVEILSHAIRSDNVTSRTRQNLALAYALDGRWREAKLMAMQDMQPATVDQRIMQWAQMARPGAYQTRVASLLNVTPAASDPGQPLGLALNAAGPVQTVAQDYRSEVVNFDKNTPLPAVGPAVKAGGDADFTAAENNMKVEKVELPASAPAPLIKAAVTSARVAPKKTFVVEKPAQPKPVKAVFAKPAPKPVKAVAVAAKPAPKPVVAAPVKKPVIKKAAFKPAIKKATTVPATNGSYLVQLGAFSSAENARRGWDILSKQNGDLSSFQYASSRITVKGKTLYRLAAMGFGNKQSAEDMCAGIKAKGGSCIVRHVKGVNPSRMATKKPTQVASR